MAEGGVAPEVPQRVTIKDRISGWVSSFSSFRRGKSPTSIQQERTVSPEPAIIASPVEPEIIPASSTLRSPEKTRADYETDHVRETEIKTVLDLLGEHPAVMILGEEGRGKSTFTGEFLKYANGHGISTGYIDVHQIEHATERANPGAAQAVIQPYLDWFDTLSPALLQQRPVLIIDAADWLYLHRGGVNTHLYGTEEWRKWQELRKNPEQWRNFVYERQKDWIHKYYNRDLKRVEDWNREHPDYPWTHPVSSIEERLQDDVDRYNSWMDEPIVKASFIDALGAVLKDEKVRIVATDHNYDRSKTIGSLEMMRKYDEVFGEAYRYELPTSFEVDRARLFLKQTYQIEDPVVQDEIIEVTGGRPNYLKNGLTSEVIEQVKNSPSSEERRRLLEEAIGKFKPKRLYPSLSAIESEYEPFD